MCDSLPTSAAYLWRTDSALGRTKFRRSKVPDELMGILATRAPRSLVLDTCLSDEVELKAPGSPQINNLNVFGCKNLNARSWPDRYTV